MFLFHYNHLIFFQSILNALVFIYVGFNLIIHVFDKFYLMHDTVFLAINLIDLGCNIPIFLGGKVLRRNCMCLINM